MQTSLLHFACCFFNKKFKGATVILLFTHLDHFEEGFRKTLFKDDDYTGKQDDVIAARESIAQKFREIRNGMTIFFTNATDTKAFSVVLSQIEDLMKARCHEEQLHDTKCDDK